MWAFSFRAKMNQFVQVQKQLFQDQWLLSHFPVAFSFCIYKYSQKIKFEQKNVFF